MIDLHNHLLPGIDDGAPDLDSALDLARAALADGITHMVCTPHIHAGRYDNTPDSIAQALTQLRAGLQQADIALRISAAAEFRFGMELMDAVRQQTVPYLGQWRDRRVLLLEFPHGELPFGAEKLTAWLLANKVLPMIAHPERNKTVLRQPGRLRPFLEQGCLLQITSGSLTGRFGTACQALARRLLELDVVTLIATDAHNLEHRPPLLAEGRDAAAQILGESRARRLVQDNPWLIAQSHFDASAG